MIKRLLLVVGMALYFCLPAMAAGLNFVTALGHTEEFALDNSISQQPVFLSPKGNILIIACTTDNPDGATGDTLHHSVFDSQGNSYRRIKERQFSSFWSAGDGLTASLWIAKQTAAVGPGDKITCAIDAPVKAKSIIANEYSLAPGQTYEVVQVTATTGSWSAPYAAVNELPTGFYALIGSVSWEGSLDDFVSGDSTYANRNGAGCTNRGAAKNNICRRDSDKLAFFGTSDTFHHTLLTPRDWIVILAAIAEVEE